MLAAHARRLTLIAIAGACAALVAPALAGAQVHASREAGFLATFKATQVVTWTTGSTSRLRSARVASSPA
jgi:hypothetical protein